MSLESCPRCGYAVAIAGGGCRHCSGTVSASAVKNWRDPKLLLPLVCVALALAILLYYILFR